VQPEVFKVERGLDSVAGLRANEDLTRFGHRLQPRRHVNRVPEGAGLLAVEHRFACENDPGVATRMQANGRADAGLHVPVEGGNRRVQLQRRADCSARVVLVCDRVAKRPPSLHRRGVC
jgi:hypothetical protein